MRIYLNSAPLIYPQEGIAPYALALEERLADPGTLQVCSDLDRSEDLCKGHDEGSVLRDLYPF